MGNLVKTEKKCVKFFSLYTLSVRQLKGENYVNFERPGLHCHLSFWPGFQLWLGTRLLALQHSNTLYASHLRPPPTTQLTWLSISIDLMPVIGIWHNAYAWQQFLFLRLGARPSNSVWALAQHLNKLTHAPTHSHSHSHTHTDTSKRTVPVCEDINNLYRNLINYFVWRSAAAATK